MYGEGCTRGENREARVEEGAPASAKHMSVDDASHLVHDDGDVHVEERREHTRGMDQNIQFVN